jgi:cytochrome P450
VSFHLLQTRSETNKRCSIPGKYAVERYPALKYLPSFLAPWKKEVLQQRQKDIQLYTELMDEVREKVVKGTAPTCFAKHLLEEQESLGMSDMEIAYTAGSPFGAGVETVSPPFRDMELCD